MYQRGTAAAIFLLLVSSVHAQSAMTGNTSQEAGVTSSSIIDGQRSADIEAWRRNAAQAKKSDFQFEIDEAFSIDRREKGAVAVAGKVLKGKAEVGDYLDVPLGSGNAIAKLKAIQMFKDGPKNLDVAFPGDMVGLIFEGISKSDLKHGTVITMSKNP
jgi:translation elongation factor EF-Tu-like GTPase